MNIASTPVAGRLRHALATLAVLTLLAAAAFAKGEDAGSGHYGSDFISK